MPAVPKPEPLNKRSALEIWAIERKKLKKEFLAKGITRCEVCPVIGTKNKCWKNNGLGFAHRHKRIWYKSSPGLLGNFNQVVLACPVGHSIIEKDRKLTEKVFKKLR